MSKAKCDSCGEERDEVWRDYLCPVCHTGMFRVQEETLGEAPTLDFPGDDVADTGCEFETPHVCTEYSDVGFGQVKHEVCKVCGKDKE